jgi:hypothetical protein
MDEEIRKKRDETISRRTTSMDSITARERSYREASYDRGLPPRHHSTRMMIMLD